MKTALPFNIVTAKEARAFLSELHANGESFHPEDDASDMYGGPGQKMFTEQEAAQLNALMGQMFRIKGFDPCGYLLRLVQVGKP